MAHRYYYLTISNAYSNIKAGETVLIDTHQQPKKGELGVYLTEDNKEIIKKCTNNEANAIGRVIFIGIKLFN
ncbi:hypothetical protein [Spartinivicinus poritis]|uniref:Uncharacterized protein n=1 Tax=Spartinivicinus poritis TaxID=2994640 RepID=A0ABT5U5J9_9GAMM|nr:hypothetical protein [Spartinivicinus sp. A2-2]MDE1461635.1 hypothetical protein [Spartinivicinus sp. A2-2]